MSDIATPASASTDPHLREWDRIIIGIDPGTNVMGYGVLGILRGKPHSVALGVIRLNKFESHYLRLSRIFERVSGLVSQYLPDEMAIEAPFFGKNVQSMLKLGRAQGVAMAAALHRDIPIAEYEPRSVKMAITGTGAASKEQVQQMLIRILKLDPASIPPELDATDALAVALCHHYESTKPIPTAKGSKSWKEFIKSNPGRVSGI